MTELETMQRAKMYMDKLAQGSKGGVYQLPHAGH